MQPVLQSPSFALRWDAETGVFHLESPGRRLSGELGADVIQNGKRVQLTTSTAAYRTHRLGGGEDVHGLFDSLVVDYTSSKAHCLAVEIRLYHTRPFVLIRLGVTRQAEAAVAVRRLFFRTLPGSLHLSGNPTGFYRHGWQSWSPAGFVGAGSRDYRPSWIMQRAVGAMMYNVRTPLPGKSGRFWSESMGALITDREALIAGGASLADQFVQVWADLRPETLDLLIQSQADDTLLARGETLFSEWFYLEWVSYAASNTCSAPSSCTAIWADPLAQYAYAVARQMHVNPPRPAPSGWSSWYMYFDQVSESDVIDNLAAAALLADSLPLQVIQLDQGFESIWGDWMERNARFPHALEWLARRIRGSDFAPGLWLSPLTVHPKSKTASDHPDWLLRDRRGRPVTAGFFAGKFFAQVLDATHPGVLAYLQELTTTAVTSWGYDYLKLDFMYAGALPGKRHDPALTRAQAYRQALETIREAAGAETYLVGCGAPLGPSIGLVDAMRIGPDTAPEWAPVFAGMRRLIRKNPFMPSLRNSLRNVLNRTWMHNRWWNNDPDNLMVRDFDTELTTAEIIAQATLIGLAGGVFVLSDDLSQLRPEHVGVAAALSPPLLEGMDALDLFSRGMPREVVAPVARPWGNWQLVGLFNWGDAAVERALPRCLPGLDLQRDYHIVDFWNRQYQKLRSGSPLPEFRIPAHGCVLLGVRVVKPAPQLVGTTFHLSQGGEIESWETRENLATLTMNLGRLADGEVWLSLPETPKAAFINDEPLARERIYAIFPGVWAFRFSLYRDAILQVSF
ncbi:MAG: alpha-galactosidase [Anaerolineae bacterium]|nr:alpha-galactosidase [Anaerolineae bacterium]